MQGSRPTYHTAMEMLLFAKTTGNFPQTFRVKPDMSTHASQSTGISKAIFINGLMNNRHTLCLSEQDGKRLLPISHKARMDICFQRNGWRRKLVADKADALIINLKAQAHFRERIEKRQQCILLCT